MCGLGWVGLGWAGLFGGIVSLVRSAYRRLVATADVSRLTALQHGGSFCRGLREGAVREGGARERERGGVVFSILFVLFFSFTGSFSSCSVVFSYFSLFSLFPFYFTFSILVLFFFPSLFPFIFPFIFFLVFPFFSLFF